MALKECQGFCILMYFKGRYREVKREGIIVKGKRTILYIVVFLFVFSMIGFAEEDEELKYGFYVDRIFVSTNSILINDVVDERIAEIGNRIVRASDRPDMKYTFRVINDSTINAYAAAGGFVYINTGLLDILESEDELACMLAHEIGHTSKSHQINFVYAAHNRKIAGEIIANIISTGVSTSLEVAVGPVVKPTLDSVLGISPGPRTRPSPISTQIIIMLTGKAGSEVGSLIGTAMAESMIKGYGKEQELEADVLAIRYTKKAGYDPNAMIGVFKRLISIRDRLGINDNNYVSSLINAEPGLEERIKQAEEEIINFVKNQQPKEEMKKE